MMEKFYETRCVPRSIKISCDKYVTSFCGCEYSKNNNSGGCCGSYLKHLINIHGSRISVIWLNL